MSATALGQGIKKQNLDQQAFPDTVGRLAVRYSLVLVLVWIGGMKFTAYEADGISAFVANSPLMSWAYSIFSVRSFSALLGVTEIAVALLIAARPLSARASLLGSISAVGMFSTTLSFLLTTPGVWEASAGGFPALSVVPGQFLIKDFVLLGAAVWLCGQDLVALTTDASEQHHNK
ncbi:YkgB family protein [bacterium]|nr:YkgB family protein [bacterium]